MNKPKHTPEPWSVVATSGNPRLYEVHASKAVLAYHLQREADARLIAKAPELLAKLKVIATMFRLVGYVREAEEIEALIAKAEGR